MQTRLNKRKKGSLVCHFRRDAVGITLPGEKFARLAPPIGGALLKQTNEMVIANVH
jgi:hypothetical protein